MTVKSADLSPAGGTTWQSTLKNARSTDELVAGMLQHHNFSLKDLEVLAIVGAAPEGQRLVSICAEHKIKIAALVDDDPNKVGTNVEGTKVQPSSEITKLNRDVPIVIASHRVVSVTERLRSLGFKTVLPFAALQLASPSRFKPHMFYDGWIEDLLFNREKYTKLNDALQDDRSRDVLSAVIQFRLTADPAVLSPVIDKGRFHQGLYHPENIFECSDDEVYVDAGAFDGDSLNWFKHRVNDRYSRIIAFEPDPKTYSRLEQNFGGNDRIDLINAGLHREKTVLRFRNDASRGAIFTDDGESSIDVVDLDSVLKGERASFIKMNIEGAEIDALEGARKTIQKWLPKLAISVYHRPSDLWQIPELIRGFSSNYDFYLRQHDGGVIETVLYAIPRSAA